MPRREHEHGFDCFGTRIRLLIDCDRRAPAQAWLDARRVESRLAALHRALTRFDPGSELSRLNARAGEHVTVSPSLALAIGAALAAAQSSDGLVDPTVLPALERAGYATSRAGAAPAELGTALAGAPARRPARARSSAAWRAITLDARRRTVRLPGGVRLDLGATAKGAAVDLAARMLGGHPAFAVDAGGDIRLGGTRPVPRTVNIDHPLRDDSAHAFVLCSGAVATSGLRTRVWRTRDGFAHHLIDPSRSEPAWTGIVQATALAPTALEADVLAKTALLRGPRAGRELLARHGGALILDDGELVLAGELAATAATNALCL